MLQNLVSWYEIYCSVSQVNNGISKTNESEALHSVFLCFEIPTVYLHPLIVYHVFGLYKGAILLLIEAVASNQL